MTHVRRKEKPIRINKKDFGYFLESLCQRQLFNKIAQGNDAWINPFRLLEPRSRPPKGDWLKFLGNHFEDKVYTELLIDKKHVSNAKQIPEMKTIGLLNDLYDTMKKDNFKEDYCLLETSFPVSDNLIRDLLDIPGSNPIPLIEKLTVRPDIIIIGNGMSTAGGKTLQEFMPDGKVKILNEKVLKSRIGINIIDVKVTRSENVGKRYFFEVIYYMKVLAHYLKDNGLENKFFIRIDYNGILAQISAENLKLLNLNTLRKVIVSIGFDDLTILYETTSTAFKNLFKIKKAGGCDVSDVPNSLQPVCTRCDFFDDCLNTLNYGTIPITNWDLKLIPYTSLSIAEELKAKGFNTIEDIYNDIDNYHLGNTPTPLYSEKPFLKKRAQAILENRLISPTPGDVFTFALPQINPIAFTFNLETDPIHDVVCVAGFHINIYLESKKPDLAINYDDFLNWWKVWEKYITQGTKLKVVHSELLKLFPEKKLAFESVKKFSKALSYLHSKNYTKILPWIELDRASKYNAGVKITKIQLFILEINENTTIASENQLANEIISDLYYILQFLSELEFFLSKQDKKIDSSIFYYAAEQMDYLQDFLHRNIHYLISDMDRMNKFKYVENCFHPSHSQVQNPLNFQKVYNLQTFMQTVMFLPLIINYTWHEGVNYLSKLRDYESIFNNKIMDFNYVYWNPHYNFIDFQFWIKYIYSKNQLTKGIILYQIYIKLISLHKLRLVFQKFGYPIISHFLETRSIEELSSVSLENCHDIAQFWHIFEIHTDTYSQMEIDKVRASFPDFGIGKLVSGKISSITQIPISLENRIFQYEFVLRDMSANMKLQETNNIIIIPYLRRDMPLDALTTWRFGIERMEWQEDESYFVRTQISCINLAESLIPIFRRLLNHFQRTRQRQAADYYRGKVRELNLILNNINYNNPGEITEEFYLYPFISNPWTPYLIELLLDGDLNYGTSWLGEVLAHELELVEGKQLQVSNVFPYPCRMPEIYMYAPLLLQQEQALPPRLSTTNYPRPDISQKYAIFNSLRRTFYSIQGPPGTGKTKTIADLIDEYLSRNEKKKTVKILVTAFTYASLRQAYYSVRDSHSHDGHPSKAASSELIFARSKSRDLGLGADANYYDFVFDNKEKDWMIRKNPEHIRSTRINDVRKLENYLNLDKKNMILFANSFSLYRLGFEGASRNKYKFFNDDFAFDLIIIDEGSQYPVNFFLAAMQFVRDFDDLYINSSNPNVNADEIIDSEEKILGSLYLETENDPNEFTKVIIVGDQNQLPPVQQVKPPELLTPILSNLFSYYIESHNVGSSQLMNNYRSNQDIVDYTNALKIYSNNINAKINKKKNIEGDINDIKAWEATPSVEDWVTKSLDQDIICCTLIHKKDHYETAVSEIEAHMVAQLVLGYFIMIYTNSPANIMDSQEDFWTERIGIVTPHNAQVRLIIRYIFDLISECSLNNLNDNTLMRILSNTVYSVEKFQGSDRDFMISSIGVSAFEQLRNEEEFIYNLNRFNVLTSRAKAKFVLVCSQNFLDYMPNDRDVLSNATKIRYYALKHCKFVETFKIPFKAEDRIIEFRKY